MDQIRHSAAVLVLTKGESESPEVLLIERSATVKTHRSQVAFPGGGTEDGEDPAQTALRECFEEVGIAPHHIEVSGILSPLPTLTGQFQVFPVRGKLKDSGVSEMILDEREVAYGEWVSIAALLKTRSEEFGFPVFEWKANDGRTRKVWGLTAIVLDRIFGSDPEGL